MANPYVIQLDLALSNQLKEGLLEQGFELATPPHTLFQGRKKNLTVTLYQSGKLVIQGKEMGAFIENYLEPELLHTFTYGYEDKMADLTPRIGVDESGKGDFFGPLVIASVYGDENTIQELIRIGVKDSKRLSDPQIAKLSQEIKKRCPHEIIKIGPEKYNELYASFQNLNLLLGWGHAKAIRSLSEKTMCRYAIIDQFAAEYVVLKALGIKKADPRFTLVQRTKGEEDPVVAAASILARAGFVEGLKHLEEKCLDKLPKGASNLVIETALRLAKQHGLSYLKSVAKIHFSTYAQIEKMLLS